MYFNSIDTNLSLKFISFRARYNSKYVNFISILAKDEKERSADLFKPDYTLNSLASCRQCAALGAVSNFALQ